MKKVCIMSMILGAVLLIGVSSVNAAMAFGNGNSFQGNAILLARGGAGAGVVAGPGGGYGPGDCTGNDGIGPGDGTGFGPGDCTSCDGIGPGDGTGFGRFGTGNSTGFGRFGPGDGTGNDGIGPRDCTGFGSGDCIR